jgi:hypothetical protein
MAPRARHQAPACLLHEALCFPLAGVNFPPFPFLQS